MKKLIAILLLASMLVSTVACAENKDDPSQDTSANETNADATEAETTDEPKLPDFNGEGADFTMLYRHGTSSYNEDFVFIEAPTGEVVDDAIFERNLAVAEKFDVNIVGIEDNMEVSNKVQLTAQANENTYDLVFQRRTELATDMVSGYLSDFNNVPEINWEAPYWDSNASTGLSLGGKQYLAVSDISLENLTNVRFLYFNRALIERYHVPDPYDYVFSDTWTLDVVLDMIKMVSDDLDGDGKMTGADRYGLLREDGGSNSNFVQIIQGCDIPYTAPGENGMPEIILNTEKVVKVIEKCTDVLLDNNITIEYGSASKGADITGYNHIYDYCRGALFTTDHFLFLQCGLDGCNTMKDMESDFGFMPAAKYDENQEHYISGVDANEPAMFIPATIEDVESIGAIIEYMAWKSHYTVFPAYYEITIKGKRVRDERDEVACDIVKDNLHYEVSDIMSFGISSMIWDGFKGNNFASKYEKKCKQINKTIEKTADKFEAIG